MPPAFALDALVCGLCDKSSQMTAEQGNKVFVVFILGGASGNVILSLVVVDFGASTEAFQASCKPPRHLHRPHTIRSAVTEE